MEAFLEGMAIVILITFSVNCIGSILLLLLFTRSLFVRFLEFDRKMRLMKELYRCRVLPKVASYSSLVCFLGLFESPCLILGRRGKCGSFSFSSFLREMDFFFGTALILSSPNRLKLRVLKLFLRLSYIFASYWLGSLASILNDSICCSRMGSFEMDCVKGCA